MPSSPWRLAWWLHRSVTGASRSVVAPTPIPRRRQRSTPISGAAPLLVQAGEDSQVRLLDLASGRDVHAKPALVLPAGEKLSASLLSADGSLLALVSGAGQVCRRFGGGSACYRGRHWLAPGRSRCLAHAGARPGRAGVRHPACLQPRSLPPGAGLQHERSLPPACGRYRPALRWLPAASWITSRSGWATSWAARRWRFTACRPAQTRAWRSRPPRACSSWMRIPCSPDGGCAWRIAQPGRIAQRRVVPGKLRRFP